MKRARLFVLTEAYLEGALAPGERDELADALEADPALREAFVEQVFLARAMRVTLRPRPHGEAWRKIEGLLTAGEQARRARVADSVDALIDGAGHAEARRRWWRRPAALGGASLGVLAAAAAVVLALRPSAAPRPDEDEAPTVATAARREKPGAAAPAARPIAPAATPTTAEAANPPAAAETTVAAASPAATAAAEAEASHAPIPLALALAAPPTRDANEMRAAEGPVFAARPDVVFFSALEGPAALPDAIRRRLRPQFVEAAPGARGGGGLRVRFSPAGAGLANGGVRFFVSTTALAAEGGGAAPAAPDELHIRYLVRPGPDFEFGAGGILPGLCGGRCPQAPRRAEPDEGWMVRAGWLPDGRLAFDHLPGVPRRALRWRRALEPGVWQAIELRVKLNTPGAHDGTVEAWVNGEPAASIGALRLRRRHEHGVEHAAFEAFFRTREGGGGPGREVDMTFDNVAVAGRYIGPGPSAAVP